MNRSVLVISGAHVERVIDVKEAMPVVERAFRWYQKERAQMPSKVYVVLPRHHGDFRAMPASVSDEVVGLKWVSVYPHNRRLRLPTVLATVILNDAKTGMPLSVMDGTYITKIRTGAAGGVAARYLARRDSASIGLLGCGVQAEVQLEALRLLFPIRRVLVWGPDARELELFVRRQRAKGIVGVQPVSTVRRAVEVADILVTTTPSRRPLVRRRWLKPGVHINAIGADAKGKQELDAEVLLGAKVVVDDWEQASHSGEINVPVSRSLITRQDIVATLGDVVAKQVRVRERAEDITVFDSTGLAVQDVAVADEVYRRCRRCHLGYSVRLV